MSDQMRAHTATMMMTMTTTTTNKKNCRQNVLIDFRNDFFLSSRRSPSPFRSCRYGEKSEEDRESEKRWCKHTKISIVCVESERDIFM